MAKAAERFTDLIVWQKSHLFVLAVYKFSSAFPNSETYGITSQLRRAAVSIPASIAEGFKKRTGPDKIRLLNIAQGSLEECRYYLILVADLGYGTTDSLLGQIEEVSKLLQSYSKAIEQNSR